MPQPALRPRIDDLVRLTVNLLARFVRLFSRLKETPVAQSKFIDLAPTDKADATGVYADALFYATNNSRVSNIALTGPYGSGKSSIIKSFLAKYDRPVLQISLAAFLPDATAEIGHVSKQEIERSILQQMLYGADANRLPLSRFKRINTPGKGAILVSLFILLGVFSCWQIFTNLNAIVSGEYLSSFAVSKWPNIAFFSVGVLFMWFVVHHVYVASFGVSLKSISLKDIEIRPIEATQDSILNRHLDEIIYFFQSTRYDLVVIEDLDRFNDAEIFVTLREINSLINANAGVKRKIRFLYALRDDMFKNIDRTKFFEFIIPVIPIINTSNSIDKVLEQEQRLALAVRLDRQFLREVSRYLDDLRLIQNIFNEYAVYIDSLETGEEKVLDPNKLLAVLIYKNVFPRDFENLHRGKGALAKILSRHDEIIALEETKLKDAISELEDQVDRAQRQLPANLTELARIYAMGLVEKLPAMTRSVGVDGSTPVSLADLPKHETFDRIIEAARIIYWDVHNTQRGLDISDLQGKLHPNKTYRERKEEIEAKSAEARSSTSKRVEELRARISSLRTTKFNEIIRPHASVFAGQFEELGDDNRLAKFLVLEGYLDDTFYQYISLFHKGRLSPNDNKFLIQIRGFSNPEPDFQVDNPKEVIEEMRQEDFGQAYVLNVRIVDCMLADQLTYTARLARLIEFISSHFDQSEAFLVTYYSTGSEVAALLTRLTQAWPDFVPSALSSPNSISHLAHLIARLPSQILQTLPQQHPQISGYVATNLPLILGLGIDVEPANLALLKVEVADLATIESFPGTARFLFEKGLYSLTANNLAFIFKDVLGLDEADALRTQNYTTVLKSGSEALRSKVERDFPEYFENVLLKLDDNSHEGVPAILSAMAHERIDPDDLRAFVDQQTALLPSLEGVPTHLHPMVFELGKIEPSWDNCVAFLASENFDADCLTAFLSTNAALDTLAAQAVPDGKEAFGLREFLLGNDAFEDSVYRTYVKLLPRQFRKFPDEIGANNLRILVEEKAVTLSAETLDRLQPDRDLQVLYVAKNIELYLADSGAYSVDDDFRESLLGSEISGDQKLSVIRSMDLSALSSMPARARAVGDVIAATGADVSMFDAAAARAAILNASTTDARIWLFNKSQKLFDKDSVREILTMLPKPFSEITTGYHVPVLEMTEQSVELADWLKAKEVISSWSKGGWFGESIRINLFRR